MFDFVFAPVAFFVRRRHRPPGWWVAGTAPLACAVLHLTAALVIATKVQPVADAVTSALGAPAEIVPVAHLFAFFSVVGYPVAYGAAVVAVIAIDALLGGSGRPARLAELVGLCFFTHVPYTAAVLAVAWMWEPDVPRWSAGASPADVAAAVDRFRRATTDAPLFVGARVLSHYAALWFVCLLGVVLRVEGGLSRAAAAGGAAFVLILMAAGQLIGGRWPS